MRYSELPLYDPVSGTGQVSFMEEPALMEKCKYCEKMVDADSMENHLRGNHGKIYNRLYDCSARIPCPLCGKHMKRIGMKSHLKDRHGI